MVTTVSGFIPQFEMNNVKILQNMGAEIHYAANYDMPSYGTDNHRLDGTEIIRHQVDFERSPFNKKNLKAYRQLKRLMEQEHFDLVHCHTPMGAVLARIVAHQTRTSPVIYTAHGFHFYKGAPLKNWLFFYPVEKYLSRYTDEQICINREDYQLAINKFHARNVDYVPGVGIDLKNVIHLSKQEKEKKRQEFGVGPEKIVILSVGELIRRKNHETILKSLAKLKNTDIVYLICGHGELQNYLIDLAKQLGLQDQVQFLGYRSDIYEIYAMADLFVFPSYQEGLPRAMMEAMASGLPVVCSDIRGNSDLMKIEKKLENFPAYECTGGLMISGADRVESYCKGIQYMLRKQNQWVQMGKENSDNISAFDIEHVSQVMKTIYNKIFNSKLNIMN